MKATCIQVYTNLNTKHGKILFYEWLMELAKKQEALNVTVFKAIAGVLDHKVEEQRFVELGANIPILISIFTKSPEPLLIEIKKQKVFFVTFPAEVG